jgi:uncharacterized protein DUF6962
VPVFSPSPTELTTAATDAAMGLLAIALLLRLHAVNTHAVWSRQVWSVVFVLLAVASVLGAVAHGFALSTGARAVLWWPLYLSLGLAIAMFLVASAADWRGERMSRRLLPWAVATGVGFFAVSQLLGGAFIIFVMYEAVAMIVAVGVYVAIAYQRKSPGAWLVSGGIALTLLAAAVQATSLQVRMIVPFDHNGLFHLVQMVAAVVLARGVRRLLASESTGSDGRSTGGERRRGAVRAFH